MTTGRSPAFQFYVDDFVAGTYYLSAQAVGAYVRLLCFQWSKGIVPSDEAELRGIAGLSEEEFGVCWDALKRKFERNDKGEWINRRLEDIRKKQLARSCSGQKGGQAKRKQTRSKLEAKKRAQGDGVGDGDRNKERNTERNGNGNRHEYTPEFAVFWEAFPPGRKTKKKTTYDAWLKAVEVASPDLIISAAREYAGSPLGKSEFVLMPATWLNGRCWEDDRVAWQRGATDLKHLSPKDRAAELLKRIEERNGKAAN